MFTLSLQQTLFSSTILTKYGINENARISKSDSRVSIIVTVKMLFKATELHSSKVEGYVFMFKKIVVALEISTMVKLFFLSESLVRKSRKYFSKQNFPENSKLKLSKK